MKIKTIIDEENIRLLIPSIKTILEKAYENKGGWFANSSTKALSKKIKEIKLVVNENDDILAVAVFEDRLGGLKCTGASGNFSFKKFQYKPAFEMLMKEIIDLDNNKYWIEASESLEHYCKKFGGNPIPAAFVQTNMGFAVSGIDNDTLHYQRYIGTDRNLCTKCMYGFRDEETREKVIDYLNSVSGIDYETFKKSVNESKKDIRPIIYKIYELCDEYEVTDLTISMKRILEKGLLLDDKYVRNVSDFLLKNMELFQTRNL